MPKCILVHRVNKTSPSDCSYNSFCEHNSHNDDKIFLKTRNVKKQHCFLLCKIIASQSLCRVFDSLFSWWLSLNCKTAIKWVWDSSCSCRGLVSWYRCQTQNTFPDRQSIRSSQTVKTGTSLLNSNILTEQEYMLHLLCHHCMLAYWLCLLFMCSSEAGILQLQELVSVFCPAEVFLSKTLNHICSLSGLQLMRLWLIG